ncbi:Protein of unknown function [Gracilibacillus ureilyticus]|uniref:DUF2621 domain-containing protein n=1 Tax=Gracilibacillus ureilyticus TaxID=531814 RepID=A0A1H9LD64_9BACI|nr:DUF2621 family protein [Gracilibacillus ureilyticus]SER09441.1 Protein of unknown function [Gracilibacillus ureilyticus]
MSFGFSMFIVAWSFILIGLLAIGGFFMFRKFLKSLPKQDGKSDLDWEKYYMERSIHLWQQPEKDFLEDLVSPVPELFRDVARQKIAARVGQLALERKQKTITEKLLIEGYILATPKRDHRFLKKKLAEKNIDLKQYIHLFDLSPENYRNKKYATKGQRNS